MKKSILIAMVALFAYNAAKAGNVPPVAVLTSTPNQTWFYNLEDVVFSSSSSYDTDGYVNYSKFYIDGVLKKSVSYTSSYSTCFALYGSPAGDCYVLANGVTTVSVKLEVRDNSGEWSSTTKVYTIQEHKGRKYFLTDHLGNVRTTVNRDGNVLGYDDYYAFGLSMPGSHSSNTSNPNDNYKFTGHERDDEAGLTVDYMNARTYDPVIGRFMQVDPLADQFPSWTPYHYVHNNPLRLTDPTGMMACEDDDTLCKYWENFISTVRDILDASSIVNINLNFGEDDDENEKEYTKEEKMIADAILQDLNDHGKKVEGIYESMEYIPVADVGKSLYEGNYGLAALNTASLFTPFGTIGKSVVKSGIRITGHGLQRLAERGITKKMVSVALRKGSRYYDPKNGTINYILPSAFGSGKSLLVGTNPITGDITTVIRSSKNLINKRFIPID